VTDKQKFVNSYIVRPLFRSPRGCRPPDWC